MQDDAELVKISRRSRLERVFGWELYRLTRIEAAAYTPRIVVRVSNNLMRLAAFCYGFMPNRSRNPGYTPVAQSTPYFEKEVS